MRFLIRRSLHSLFLLIGASFLSFALVGLVPGDYFDTLRLNPQISRSTVEAFRKQFGSGEALPVRYLHWIESAVQGDWGTSLAYNSPAAPILRSRAANTLLLTGTATLLAWCVALPLGTFAAVRRGTWIDYFASASTTVLLATPELVLGLLLLLVALRSGWFPAGGLSSIGLQSSVAGAGVLTRGADVARHLVLPAICLSAGLLPMLLSHVRASVGETLEAPFVGAARALGIPFRRVVTHHVFPAALNPLLTLLGLSIGMLVSSSLVVEFLFSWPGLGQLIIEAILQRDFFLVIDAGILATSALIAGNFLADLLLYASDPRIRGS